MNDVECSRGVKGRRCMHAAPAALLFRRGEVSVVRSVAAQLRAGTSRSCQYNTVRNLTPLQLPLKDSAEPGDARPPLLLPTQTTGPPLLSAALSFLSSHGNNPGVRGKRGDLPCHLPRKSPAGEAGLGRDYSWSEHVTCTRSLGIL